MMHISCSKDVFLKTLSAAMAVVDPRPSTPALACVRVSTSSASVSVAGSGIKGEVRAELKADVIKPGAIELNAAGLYDRVSALLPGAPFDLYVDGSFARIRQAGRKMAMAFLPPSRCDAGRDMEAYRVSSFGIGDLVSTLAKATFFAEKAEGAAHNAIELNFEEDHFTVAASEGHFSIFSTREAKGASFCSVISGESARAAAKALSSTEGEAKAWVQGSRLYVASGSIVVSIPTTRGELVITKPLLTFKSMDTESVLSYQRADILGSLEAVGVATKGDFCRVVGEFGLDTKFVHISEAGEEIEDSIVAKEANGSFQMKLNSRLAARSIKSIDGESVILAKDPSVGALFIKSIDGRDFCAIAEVYK